MLGEKIETRGTDEAREGILIDEVLISAFCPVSVTEEGQPIRSLCVSAYHRPGKWRCALI